MGLDPDDFILLSIGRLAPLKGQARIVEALALLTSDARPKLVFVGGDGPSDPEQQRLGKMAAHAGLAKRVMFIGSLPHQDLPVFYAAANVFVQASHYESFGLVGLEAMACGCPVVTSPVGIMASLGARAQPGCLLTNGSPADLAAGIAAIRAKKKIWSPAAIRVSVKGFGWPQAADAALAAYRSAIHRHAAAGLVGRRPCKLAHGRERPCSTDRL